MGAKEKAYKWNVMALEFQLEFGVAFALHVLSWVIMDCTPQCRVHRVVHKITDEETEF